MRHIYIISLSILFLLQGCGESESNTNPTEESGEKTVIDLPLNPTFSRVNSHVVKENQSNLYWQDNLEAKTTIEKFAVAESYCSSLILEEIDSWRLPTYKELLSLVHQQRNTPAIYDDFQNTDSKEYWTKTRLSSNSSLWMWTVDFKRGLVNYQTGAYPATYSTTHNVRCVSDEFTNKRTKEHNFTKDGDLVTDNIHNLLWQDSVETKVEKRSFNQSDAYCDNLSLGQYNSGWRLPTVEELSSLIDVSNNNPAIASTFSNSAYNDAYWTSEAQHLLDSNKWNITFKDGKINLTGTNHASFDQYVRCVRDKD